MEQKIEELNQKYSILISDVDNFNTKFTKNLQIFYLIAIAAGQEDFQRRIQATKKLKNLIGALFESLKYANQIIVKEALDSIQILITTLLQSTRWQDNNAGIWIIIVIIIFIFYSVILNQTIISQIQLIIFQFIQVFIGFFQIQNIIIPINCIKKLSQIIKLHLTQYLEQSEEIFQENTSKLLTLLNEKDIYQKPEYLVIQEKIISSMNSSLQLSEKFQDYFQVIVNYLNQNNHQLIGLHTQKIDFQEKYFSKIQLSPLLQILKELSTKTNIHNYTDLLLKCCLINQKQTQLYAFNLLLQIEVTNQNDFIEVLRYSLLHNNIEIITLGTQLAKQVIKNFDCSSLSDIKLLIYLNQGLQPVKDISLDLLQNGLNDLIVRENLSLILNICSIQAQNKDRIFRVQSWRNLIRAIKTQSNQEISQNIEQIIQLCQTAQNESDEMPVFFFLFFVEQVIQKRQNLDKNEHLVFAKILCNFVGQFKNQQNSKKIFEIFKIFDFNDEQLSQLQSQSEVQNSTEIQQAWKDLRQQLQQVRQHKI